MQLTNLVIGSATFNENIGCNLVIKPSPFRDLILNATTSEYNGCHFSQTNKLNSGKICFKFGIGLAQIKMFEIIKD